MNSPTDGGSRMDAVRTRLEAAGWPWPAQAAAPLANYRTAVVGAGLVMTSGHVPVIDGSPTVAGTLGVDVPAAAAARAAGSSAVAAIASAFAAIAPEQGLVPLRLTVYIAAAPSFAAHPTVADGASEALRAGFGTVPARSAVGVSSLPLGVPVEVELTCAVVDGNG